MLSLCLLKQFTFRRLSLTIGHVLTQFYSSALTSIKIRLGLNECIILWSLPLIFLSWLVLLNRFTKGCHLFIKLFFIIVVSFFKLVLLNRFIILKQFTFRRLSLTFGHILTQFYSIALTFIKIRLGLKECFILWLLPLIQLGLNRFTKGCHLFIKLFFIIGVSFFKLVLLLNRFIKGYHLSIKLFFIVGIRFL